MLVEADLEKRADRRRRNGAKVDSKAKDGKVVVDGTEVLILGIGQQPFVDELTSNIDICSRLVCEILGLVSGIEPTTVYHVRTRVHKLRSTACYVPIPKVGLLVLLGKCKLLLTPDLVIGNSSFGHTVPPFCSGGVVS